MRKRWRYSKRKGPSYCTTVCVRKRWRVNRWMQVTGRWHNKISYTNHNKSERNLIVTERNWRERETEKMKLNRNNQEKKKVIRFMRYAIALSTGPQNPPMATKRIGYKLKQFLMAWGTLKHEKRKRNKRKASKTQTRYLAKQITAQISTCKAVR